MRAYLTLAESASTHPDGTVSVLRSGINSVSTCNDGPVAQEGVLFGRIETEPKDAGIHKFEIRAADSAGIEFLPRLQGELEAPQGGGFINLILRISFVLPTSGKYEFTLLVGEQPITAWGLTCSVRTPQLEEKHR
jgi:hypothetical protein